MAGDIKLSANFQANVAKPLDDKFVVADETARDALTFVYAGLLVYLVSEDRYDYWDGSAWVEDFGAGGSLTISANGTPLTTSPSEIDFGDRITATESSGVVSVEADEQVLQYNSGGQITGALKVWRQTVTTDGDGRLTVDYSSAGFSSAPHVSVSAHSDSTNTLQNREWATLRGSPGTTSCRIYTIRGNVIISLLLGGGVTVREAPNVKVDVIAMGV